MKIVRVEIQQVSGNSTDLTQCIEEFDFWRGGAGLLSCDASDQQMIDHIVGYCEEFIEEHQPHFDWCEMRVLVADPHEPEPIPDNVIRRVGEWDIGRVHRKICRSDDQETLWRGHCSTDEEMGCGQIEIEHKEVVDYDNWAGYGLPSEVVKALALEGYDVSYLEDEDNA